MHQPAILMSDLLATDADAIEQTARLLVEAFRGHTLSWPDMPRALEEVRESFEEGRVSRVARAADGRVVGWIGAIPQYGGHVWELHPVAVRPDLQRQGLGRLLLADIERLAAARGVLTLWVGADDEDGRTSLTDVDPYPDALSALAAIRNVGDHPFEFYQKCGFSLVGMLPDANGLGKPDIFMARRIQRGTS
jgi:aminoglycoside 6'-N-acetyltransferase I